MMDDLITIKGCPWCNTKGRGPVLMQDGERYSVWCSKCGCDGPHEKSKTEAIKAWNTRHGDSA